MTDYSYESCNLAPWIEEIVSRMRESHAAGTPVVNLSFSHPRGYIPPQILRRKQVRELLNGWQVNAARVEPDNYPAREFAYSSDPKIVAREIELREAEAAEEAARLTAANCHTHIPIADLTNFHPRGGIPEAVLNEVRARNSIAWRVRMNQEIHRLQGEANRAEALSKTLLEKADGVDDPRKLKAASKDQMRLAEDLRHTAAALQRELDD